MVAAWANGISSTTHSPAPTVVRKVKASDGNSRSRLRRSASTTAASTSIAAATHSAACQLCGTMPATETSMMPAAQPSRRSTGTVPPPLRPRSAGTTTQTSRAKIAISGTLTRKAARQDTVSVSTPDSSGPPKAAAAQTIASAPNTLGISRDGNISGISA